ITGRSRMFLLAHHDQTALDHCSPGRRAGACEQPFHALSREYFAREAHHHFAIEATVFCLLLLTTVLPLLNGAKAVLGLVESDRRLTGLSLPMFDDRFTL